MSVAQILKKNNLVTLKTLAAELGISYVYCVIQARKFGLAPNGRILTGKRGSPPLTFSRSAANHFKRYFEKIRKFQ
jgi:hypothetical protein